MERETGTEREKRDGERDRRREKQREKKTNRRTDRERHCVASSTRLNIIASWFWETLRCS